MILLKSDLLNLPISSLDKVNLWLVITNQKPTTDITVKNTLFEKNSLQLHPSNKNIHLIKRFLNQNKLHYKIIENKISGNKRIKQKNKFVRTNISIIQKMFLVSKQTDKLHKLEKYWGKIGRETQMNIGLLYGYPPKAVEEFAKDTRMEDGNTLESKYKKVDWVYYVRYKTRIGHDKEDCLIAQKWCRTIKKDLPKLHQEFVKEMKESKWK